MIQVNWSGILSSTLLESRVQKCEHGLRQLDCSNLSLAKYKNDEFSGNNELAHSK